MTIQFGPAEAKPKKVIVGLSGGTGSGKTRSALEIGSGLVADPEGELFMIDTEFGRGAHYASTFKFQYGQLSPPFRPERYIDAIDEAIGAGAKCVIIDSLSHIWEGEAGLLDWHGDIALKMAKGDEARAEIYNFPAWRLPKQELQRFVLYLQRCPIHLILCLRAKQKSKMVKAVGQDGRTKTEIVDAGLQPIIDTATPYEATFLAMLSQEEPGVPHWTHKALASYLQPIFTDGPKQLSREHGKRLAEWCHETGVGQPISEAQNEVAGVHPPSEGAQKPKPDLDQAAQIAAELKTAAMSERAIIWLKHWPVIEQLPPKWIKRLEELRDKGVPQPKDAGPVDDDFAHLEPPEWQEQTGRVEDERQEELLP
jgi:hypothetical protein